MDMWLPLPLYSFPLSLPPFLPSFQIRCFDAPLQPNALKDVKNIVKRNTNLGIENNGVTLEGQYYT